MCFLVMLRVNLEYAETHAKSRVSEWRDLVGMTEGWARLGPSLLDALDAFDDYGFQGYGLLWLVLRVAGHLGDFLDYVVALDDFPENGVLPRQPLGGGNRDEKLRAVGVGTGIRHRQFAWLAHVVRRTLGLVFKAIARTTHAAAGRIAALNHEVGDDAVKDGAVIQLAGALLVADRVG